MKFVKGDKVGSLILCKTVVYWCQGGLKMTYKTEVKLRLPQELKDRLQKEAEKQKRSVNNLLEVIIEDYLNNK